MTTPAETTKPTTPTVEPVVTTPVVPAAPATHEAKPPQPISAEAKPATASQNFMDNLLKQVEGKNLPAKVDEKKVEAKPVAKVESKEEPVTPVAPAEPRVAKKPKGVKAQKTPEEIGAAAGAAAGVAAADAMIRTAKPPEPPAPKVEQPVLPPEFKRDEQVYQQLAQSQPEKYGKLIPQLSTYSTEFKAYKKKWQSENPGQAFDINNTEHDEWANDHMPVIDPEDMQQARVDLQVAKAVAPTQEKLNRLESERAQQQFEQQVTPKIQSASNNLLNSAIVALDPSLKDSLGDPALLKKIDQEMPELSLAVETAFKNHHPLVVATTQLFSSSGKLHNPKNVAHQQVDALLSTLEATAAAMPADELVDSEGRTFITIERYVGMKPADRRQHWIIGEQDVQRAIRDLTVQQAKALYDADTKRIDELAARRGWVKQDKVAPKVEPSKEVKTTTATAQPSGSPSVTTGAPVIGGGKTVNTGAPTFFDNFSAAAFGRKP